MTVADLLKLEAEHRKAGRWLMFAGEVMNDRGVTVSVQLKSYGLYNQIFRLNNDGIDYASGHTINKVGVMKKHIAMIINMVRH